MHLHNQISLPPTGLHSQAAASQLKQHQQPQQHQQHQQQHHQQQHHHQQQQQQQHQPPSAVFIVPPVAALESSQLLETSFESLPPFGQPLMHLPHHAGNTSPAPPHLNAHSAGPVSPETHPFLNQHPILPSPGKDACGPIRRSPPQLLTGCSGFQCVCLCICKPFNWRRGVSELE